MERDKVFELAFAKLKWSVDEMTSNVDGKYGEQGAGLVDGWLSHRLVRLAVAEAGTLPL